MTVAPTLLPAIRETASPPVQALPVAPPTDHSPAALAEEHRWLLMLVIPFAVSAAVFGAAIGTGLLWLMGPAAVLGPGLIIIGFVYLGLTSDKNNPE
jgi:hypothetical protein